MYARTRAHTQAHQLRNVAVFCPNAKMHSLYFFAGPEVADKLNNKLWEIAKTSYCPCLAVPCYTHNAVVMVAIVKKLRNTYVYLAAI